MDTLLTQGCPSMPSPEKMSRTPEARTARGAFVIAAIWLALALGSPLIVRYAPSTDDRAMAALVTRLEQPRCAATPDVGAHCASRTLVAHDSDLSKEPDL